MANKFQKKNFAKLRKAEEAILDKDLEEFQGSKVELFFIKLGRKISRNRLPFFGSILGFFLLLGSVLGYLEYREYREARANEELENILESWDKNFSLDLETRLSRMKEFQANRSTGKLEIRVSKILADLYFEKGEYAQAAELLEKAGLMVSDFREAKAYYFYIAGNYRDLAGNKELALKNYETAVSLLENIKETAAFRAWSLFHSGRLQAELGNPGRASEHLRNVLLVESADSATDLSEVKKLSTYLLLKLPKEF